MEIVQALIDFLFIVLQTLSGWVRPYLADIGLAMAATLLVIYGQDITDLLKKQIGSLGFVLKISLFVLFCAVGSGLIMSFITPLITNTLVNVSNDWLGILVIGAFYVIGYLAQRKGMI